VLWYVLVASLKLRFGGASAKAVDPFVRPRRNAPSRQAGGALGGRYGHLAVGSERLDLTTVAFVGAVRAAPPRPIPTKTVGYEYRRPKWSVKPGGTGEMVIHRNANRARTGALKRRADSAISESVRRLTILTRMCGRGSPPGRVVMRSIRRAAGAVSLIAFLMVPSSPIAISPVEAAAPAPTAAAAKAGTPEAAVKPAVVSIAPVEPVCGLAEPGYAHCLALRRTDIPATPAVAMSPSTVPAGYGPADLKSAYALPGGTAGSGMTVAVVDAYDLPTAEADLAVYRAQYGLPACTTANGCFRKVNQTGGSSYPAVDKGWGQEIALDIDMVSATCPNCHILLVETNTAASSDLGIGVNTAVSLGAMAVSNSYGRLESSGDTALDTAYYNHPGVAITAASGDWGYSAAPLGGDLYVGVEYPAASPDVVAVGGTSLVKDDSSGGWSESAWGDFVHDIGAGSGCAAYEPKPAWQTDSQCAKRMVSDISAVADPNTGVASYDSGAGGWAVMGGTSASSPIIAAVFALAGTPAAGSYPASFLYSDTADLYDVTDGGNDVWGLCTIEYFCTGAIGYDGPTGLGTPIGTGAFWGQLPPKITGVAAFSDNTSAVISWSAVPAHGSRTTTYTVTSSPDGKTCTSTAGVACTVYGLTNGTSYRFTVAATNHFGTGPSSDPSNAVTPGIGAIAAAVASGNEHTCALLANGTVECWGLNNFGQLGDGTTANRSAPAAVAGLTGVTAITAGGNQSCALLGDGTARCWGDNYWGQLGNGSWGAAGPNSMPVTVEDLAGATAISTVDRNTCAIVAGGGVDCWGVNQFGELGVDGGVLPFSPNPLAVSGLAGVTAVATGNGFVCALLSGGTVDCWGMGLSGQLGDGTSTSHYAPAAVSGLTGVTAIATGNYHACAVVAGGAVQCWGYNDYGQLGSWAYPKSAAPAGVAGVTGATKIAAGLFHTCVVISGGGMQCWGENYGGQLGNGSTADSHTPVAVSELVGATAVSAGGIDTCAVVTGGALKCWGYNVDGEVGDGTTTPRSTPVTVLSFPTVPAAPMDVTAVVYNQSALVSWTAPDDIGGSTITAYAVTSSPGGKTCGWTVGPLSCTVQTLTNGQHYTFTVTATNGTGTGPASDPSNSVTPAAVPAKPTGVTASRGNTTALVSWTPPADIGGSTITAYTVTSSPGGKTCGWTSGPTSCTVTTLTNGQAYTFTVTATNGAGTGPASDPSAAVTPATVPGKPTGVNATAGAFSALVSWVAPADNGGNSITGYTVTSSPEGKTCGWSSGPLRCTVGSLSGQTYAFTVTATNDVGTGQPSDASTGVIVAGPATTFVVSGLPSPLVAMTAHNVTVTAKDTSGNTAVGYTGTVHFTSTDPAATLPGDYTFTLADAGVHTFIVTLKTAGTRSVSATDSVSSSITGIQSGIVVYSGATYQTVTPYRVLDSRMPRGGTLFRSQQKQTVTIATADSGVPTNAVAVTGNVTVVGQTSAGYITVAPSLTSGVQPPTSTLNFPLSDIRANGVTVPLAGGGKLDFMYWAASTSATVQVIFDVTGFFSK
jgi:hypothetical protein